jgi:hypothetical protein
MSPTSERLLPRPSVEARVQLDCVELLCVPVEPIPGCQRGLVQDCVPVVVAPSARTDPDVTHSSPIAASCPPHARGGLPHLGDTSYVWVLVIANNPIPGENSVLRTLVIANDPNLHIPGRDWPSQIGAGGRRRWCVRCPGAERAAELRRSESDSSEVEHEREDEDDCPGPDGINDEVTGLPAFQAGERHAATQEAEEQPC